MNASSQVGPFFFRAVWKAGCVFFLTACLSRGWPLGACSSGCSWVDGAGLPSLSSATPEGKSSGRSLPRPCSSDARRERRRARRCCPPGNAAATARLLHGTPKIDVSYLFFFSQWVEACEDSLRGGDGTKHWLLGGVCPYLVVLFLCFEIGLETQVPLHCSFSSVDK